MLRYNFSHSLVQDNIGFVVYTHNNTLKNPIILGDNSSLATYVFIHYNLLRLLPIHWININQYYKS